MSREGKIVIGSIVFMMLCFAVLIAQDKPKSYAPTEVQTLRLQVKQKDAQLAQRDLQFAQQRFQQAIQDLNQEAEKIKIENKWPLELSFSPDTLTFSEPPKKTEKPTAPVVK